jgi:carbon starvation protein
MKRQGVLLTFAVIGALLAWAVSEMTHEQFNAVALLVAAVCFYYIGGRFYSGFIADRVVRLDDGNVTPAHRLRDDKDFMPFRRWTLFGMHFAWIAGPGPLIGPTLAAQFGFLPGFVWIVLGAVLMGCVQDMVILVFSTRRDGMSLAKMIRKEVSPIGGFFASLAVLFILEILLGVLALVVVNALKGSSWATFTIFMSIPIAFLVGWYMTKLRPGHEGQATAIGVALLIVATAVGHWVPDVPILNWVFKRADWELGIAITIYGFMAAALPAWMLLAPRDNISTYLKIGTVFLLAIGILFARPVVHMPAVVHFKDGVGPIVAGGLFPFCFIIIACGAISGFHSLISSGTTPRFVDKETDIRPVGYGAMLTESFVGVMALIAAVTLAPGIYMAMNHPPLPGAPTKGKPTATYEQKVTAQISTAYGATFQVTPQQMQDLAVRVKEDSLYHRTGGGPSLAVGMANIFSNVLGGGLLAFWYHFALMFEAVFVLTVLDSGTRVIRFVVHELLHDFAAMRAGPTVPDRELLHAKIPVWLTSALAVIGWSGILFWGILDAEGGTRALFKMFGTANQLLAVIALTLATVIMLRRHRRHVWVTAVPLLVLGTITMTAAYQSVFSSHPKIGAIAQARDVAAKLASGAMPAAKAATATNNAWLTAILSLLLLFFVVAVLIASLKEAISIWRNPGAPPPAQPTHLPEQPVGAEG